MNKKDEKEKNVTTEGTQNELEHAMNMEKLGKFMKSKRRKLNSTTKSDFRRDLTHGADSFGTGAGSGRKTSNTNTTPTESSNNSFNTSNTVTGEEGPEDHMQTSVTEAACVVTKVSFLVLFRYANVCDYFLMTLGLLFALMSSVLLPFLIYSNGLFYRLLTAIYENCGDTYHGFGTETQLMLEVSVINGFCSFVFHWLFMLSAERQLKKIRLAYVESILKKDHYWLDSYVDHNLTFRPTNDIIEIRSGIGECVPKLVHAIVTSVVLISLAFFVNHKLTMICSIAIFPLIVICIVLKSVSETMLVKKEQQAYSNADVVGVQVLSSIRTVILFAGKKKELERYRSALFSPFVLWKPVLFGALSSSILWILPVFMWSFNYYMSITYLIPTNVAQGEPFCQKPPTNGSLYNWDPLQTPLDLPEISQLFVVFYSCSTIAKMLSAIPDMISKIHNAKRIAAEVFFTIDWKSSIENLSDEGEIPRLKSIGKLQMKDVTFAYPRKRTLGIDTVAKINITIFPGEMVTLFGPKGSGKTTILMLLLRHYDPYLGKIRLDGMGVRNLNIGWYRKQFGVVPQDIVLFDGTIFDNIRNGNLKYTMTSVVAACTRVAVHNEILALPDGYETKVGLKSKVELSDLQLKKISLARAILHHPTIILLDDFITNLDDDFEDYLLTVLNSLREKYTIIMTTRTPNSIMKSSDVIYAIKNGRILESGDHESLVVSRQKSYVQMLEESLEDTINIKPYFDSQLLNYLFAEAIVRKHDHNDIQRHMNCNQILKEYITAADSILLRHVVSEYNTLTIPRTIGGFHQFSAFPYKSNIHFYKHLVRNNLVRARDRRLLLIHLAERKGYIQKGNWKKRYSTVASITRLQGRFSGISDVSTASNHEPRPDKPTERETGFGLDMAANAKTEDRKAIEPLSVESNRKKHTKPRSRTDSGNDDAGRKPEERQELFVNTSFLTKMNTNANANANANSNISNLSNNMGVPPTDVRGNRVSIAVPKSDDDDQVIVIDDKLQHYYGWTINSFPDDESISSVDSNAFWNRYNLDLLLALIQKSKTASGNFFCFIKYAWPYLIFSCLTSAGFGIALIYMASISTRMAFAFLKTDKDKVTYNAVVFVYLGAMAALCSFAQEIILGFGYPAANNKLRVALFRNFLNHRIEWFDVPQNDVEVLRASLASDVASIHIALFTTFTIVFEVTAIIGGLCFILVYMTNLYPYSYWLIPIVIGHLLVNCLEGRMAGRYNYFVSLMLKPATKVTFDIITNLKLIHILNLEEHFLEQYVAAQRKCRWKLGCLAFTGSVTFGLSRAGLYLFFGIWMCIMQDAFKKDILLDVNGLLFNFVFLGKVLSYCVQPAGFALATLPSYSDMKFISDLATQIFRHQETVTAHTHKNEATTLTVDVDSPPPKVELKNVTFEFPFKSSDNLLKGVSCEFLPGQFVAIVGPPGCGKLAVIYMLLKKYYPTGGNIFFDQVDYTKIDDRYLRRTISFVSQDPRFFPNKTIAENIAYGDNSRKVTQQEIEAAARLAFIDTIIETSFSIQQKYDTKLEDLPDTPEMFVFRQRMGVARAAIANPKILLVDEATTSVDAHSSLLLLEALMNLREGRTMIVSSQRIEPIRNADIIYVFQEGLVVESGTDTELITNRGVYYELLMGQMLYESNKAHNRKSIVMKL